MWRGQAEGLIKNKIENSYHLKLKNFLYLCNYY